MRCSFHIDIQQSCCSWSSKQTHWESVTQLWCWTSVDINETLEQRSWIILGPGGSMRLLGEENDGSNPNPYWTPDHEPWLRTPPLTCIVYIPSLTVAPDTPHLISKHAPQINLLNLFYWNIHFSPPNPSTPVISTSDITSPKAVFINASLCSTSE